MCHHVDERARGFIAIEEGDGIHEDSEDEPERELEDEPDVSAASADD